MIEYALLAALISLTAIAGITSAGSAAASQFWEAGRGIASGTNIQDPPPVLVP